MSRKLRVLAVAPYEGMRSILQSVAPEFPQIELTVFVGDLKKGLEVAQENFHKNYDAVVSRGMTAKLLSQLPIPVIDIKITVFDILGALKSARGQKRRIAIASYADITEVAGQLVTLLDEKVDVFTIDKEEKTEEVLLRIQKEGYDAVLCDMSANTVAQRLGMESYLITSGPESIRAAFDETTKICHAMDDLRSENKMLRRLINSQLSQTVLFDDKANVLLSTQDEEAPKELFSLFRNELEETKIHTDRRIIKNRGGRVLSIRANRFEIDDTFYTAFFYTSRKSALSKDKTGIQYSDNKAIQQSYYSSLFFLADTRRRIPLLSSRFGTEYRRPVVLAGEIGTGKDSTAELLYLEGSYADHPFITIDCYRLEDKGWEFLLEHNASPLGEKECTLYFKNLDKVPPSKANQLLSALRSMDTCLRNHVYFSVSGTKHGELPPVVATFADVLTAITVFLPPLREQKDIVPTLFNRLLNALKAQSAEKLAGADDEALAVLADYPWPHNFSQFQRVVQELLLVADKPILDKDDINKVLQKETNLGASSEAEDAYLPIDLQRPLKDIEKDVVLRVLKENGNNQTEASRSLDISRTTLWRILKTE